MKLPGGEHAVIPDGKLETYCLDLSHVDGGPKARVFAAALGLTLKDADVLRDALLSAAQTAEATYIGDTGYGARYRVLSMLEFRGRAAVIRSGWIIRDGVAHLATAFVEKVR